MRRLEQKGGGAMGSCVLIGSFWPPRERSICSAVRRCGSFWLLQLQEDIMVQLGHHLMKQYHKAHTVIRFAMGGCANRPYFRIVAAQNKRARDGKYYEQIGCYDPLPNDHDEKIVGLNFERLKHWIANGAHLSKPVEKLLGLSGFFPLHPMTIVNAERLKKKKALEAALAAAAAATPAEENPVVKE